MKENYITLHNRKIKKYTVNTLVIGSGAAGYAAAVRLWEGGNNNIALLTEDVLCGTSRNAGSDKQTYYKMGISADGADCPAKMAEDLFSGGATDGDTAYCEAANSLPCFFRLAQMGVAFPVNRYGEFVGYRTDHDTAGRATSAGPLTSKMMTECWEKQFNQLGIARLEGLYAVEILKNESNAVCGVVALRLQNTDEYDRFVLVQCENVILATGGHAAVYWDTVYPNGFYGSSGIAVQAGAVMQNLTEWQYGLASVSPKWNVSGTYMQSLPSLISEDAEGNRTDILQKYIPDIKTGLSLLFRKGYEWPFDSVKAETGSSVIDLLVHKECCMDHTVYLDYSVNPYGEDFSLELLDGESRNYLASADALCETPLQRLLAMNTPAYELYLGKGVDLACETLEIALCAQHCNGGVAVDAWWQSSVAGLFVCGEAAGTHGVRRPGGSALNAGQVGALRASAFINAKRKELQADEAAFFSATERFLSENAENARSVFDLQTLSSRVSMSEYAGAVRTFADCKEVYDRLCKKVKNFTDTAQTALCRDEQYYRCLHVLYSQTAMLNALCLSAEKGIVRGGAIWTDVTKTADENLLNAVVETVFDGDGFVSRLREPRPLPAGGGFFEDVWKKFRENGNVE